MPWKIDETGKKKYEISIYDKECLPTWDEIYNKFYKNQIFKYDPDNQEHQILQDVYWKRPSRKLLLAWTCNQLNKMIFEDGIDVVEFINNKYGVSFDKLHFIIIEDSLIKEGAILPECIVDLIDLKGPPKIYSCKIPSTNQYSVFQTKHPQINIDDLIGHVRIVAAASTDVGISIPTYDELLDIINFILKDIINYFENGIGWKDKEGNMMPVDQPSRNCEGAGFDPAL